MYAQSHDPITLSIILTLNFRNIHELNDIMMVTRGSRMAFQRIHQMKLNQFGEYGLISSPSMNNQVFHESDARVFTVGILRETSHASVFRKLSFVRRS